MLSHLDFKFITIAIKKNDFVKTASNIEITEQLIDEIEKYCPKIRIIMDINPQLHERMRKEIHKRGLTSIKVTERKSHIEALIQLADYVVNISFKRIKNPDKAKKWFNSIRKKCLVFKVS